MARRAKSVIPLTMYKHFAVVTLALTAGIAMLAETNAGQAHAGHIKPSVEQVEIQPAPTEPSIQTAPVVDTSSTGGAFGSDDTGDYGRPTVTPVSAGGNSWTFHTPSTGSRPAVAGYDQDTIEMMTEEEYRAFLEALPPETVESMASAEERAEQIAALERASANRSGRRHPTSMAMID